MKKQILTLLCLISIASPSFALEAGDRSVSGTFGYYGAGGNFFDTGYGFDFAYSFWRSHEKALAITTGIQSWEVKKQSGVDLSGNTAFGATQDGAATLFPIGLSMIWRNAKEGSERIDLGFQLGVQYIFATSDADQQTVIQRVGGAPVRGKRGIDFGSNLIGKVAIEVDYLLSEQADFIVDFGYQMDFLKGDIDAGSGKIDDLELKGFFVRTGLGYRF
ncbi:MAG: hypothetical protein ACI9TH_000212 [Kiritimatiellia bacterium]|jgi:hypothetical protein